MSTQEHADEQHEAPAVEASEELSDSEVVVRDGGWGWVVVVGTFMIHVIAHGVLYSFGVFVDDLVDYFDSSRSAVGGISSLMLGVTWASGTIMLITYN